MTLQPQQVLRALVSQQWDTGLELKLLKKQLLKQLNSLKPAQSLATVAATITQYKEDLLKLKTVLLDCLSVSLNNKKRVNRAINIAFAHVRRDFLPLERRLRHHLANQAIKKTNVIHDIVHLLTVFEENAIGFITILENLYQDDKLPELGKIQALISTINSDKQGELAYCTTSQQQLQRIQATAKKLTPHVFNKLRTLCTVANMLGKSNPLEVTLVTDEYRIAISNNQINGYLFKATALDMLTNLLCMITDCLMGEQFIYLHLIHQIDATCHFLANPILKQLTCSRFPDQYEVAATTYRNTVYDRAMVNADLKFSSRIFVKFSYNKPSPRFLLPSTKLSNSSSNRQQSARIIPKLNVTTPKETSPRTLLLSPRSSEDSLSSVSPRSISESDSPRHCFNLQRFSLFAMGHHQSKQMPLSNGLSQLITEWCQLKGHHYDIYKDSIMISLKSCGEKIHITSKGFLANSLSNDTIQQLTALISTLPFIEEVTIYYDSPEVDTADQLEETLLQFYL